MKHERRLHLRGAMLGSLGVGVVSVALLSFSLLWSHGESEAFWIVLLVVMPVLYGYLAYRFRKMIWVLWGSLIIGQTATVSGVVYAVWRSWPNVMESLGSGAVWFWWLMIAGVPTFLLTLGPGFVGYVIGYDVQARIRRMRAERDTIALARCVSCGYSHAGLTAPVCPEYGRP